MPQILEQGFKHLRADKLWNSAYQEPMIKPLLDLITENTSGHFLKACQIEPDDEHLAKRCRDIQTAQPMLECEWSIYGSNVDQLDADLLSEYGLKATKVDFDKTKVEETEDFDFILLDRVLHRKTNPGAFLKNVTDLLRTDGFVVVCETTDCFEIPLAMLALRGQLVTPQKDDSARRHGIFYDRDGWTSLFEKCGFHVVSRRSADLQSMMTLFLLRRPSLEDQKSQTINVDDVKEFSWLKPLQKAVDETDDDKIWLTSETSRDNGAVGMGLCLRAEVSKDSIRTLINSNMKDETKPFTVEDSQVQKIMANDMHSNIYRDGTWGTFRHIQVKDDELHNFIETEHAFINTLIPGDLGSLTWVDSPNKFFSVTDAGSSKKILCDVHYAPLNFRDIMLATGRLSGDSIPGEFSDRECLLGLEFSGRCPATGQMVMGLAKAQALATTVLTEKRFTWAVPKGWTLEQASTVPVAYTTAYYALVVRGRIKTGDKVLIHAGSGGVGQAAIAVALSLGCEVFTTVSSPEKKKFLQDRFPGRLLDRHFANSRSTDFEQHVLEVTEGRGVDAVLNSLSDDKLQASVRCLAQHGRFLEIGKFDLSNNSQLGMAVFLKNVSFHGILLDALFDDDSNDWLEVSRLFEEGLKNGTVKALPTTVFPAGQATEAFRFMAQGKHIGKVLLQVRPSEEKISLQVKAVRRTLCNPRHSFIITGGLGGFGLELAQWLIKRGARKLVLTSRSGIKTGYQNRCCSAWKKSGVEILISKADISKPSGCEQLIKEAQHMGPLAGLFHLAMVLRDNIFENQTVQNFKESAEAKYWGTTYLDQMTRKMCGKDLNWFVVFSSISCGRGNAGQTNYGWTNSTMERIIEKRRADGFSGMAVQWGAIGDVGVVLETMGDNNTVVGGTLPQRIPSCMQAMDLFLSWNHPIVSSFVRAETVTASRAGGEGQTDAVKMVAQIMGVSDPASIDHNAQFGDLGLDSLMGVEIKQALERNFSLNLSPKEIRTMTLNKLRETTSTKSKSSAAPAIKLATEQNGSVANGSSVVTA
uniref:Fatty acid synthase n=1 Tax=Romanomermis culicivorax TaxID=13658 RepID=A0A915JP64_ROMCU